MILRKACLGLVLGFSAAVAACGPNNNGGDAGDSGNPTNDTPMTDGPVTDTPGTDGGDGGLGACGMITPVVLDGMGTTGSDGALHVMLNNDSANTSQTAGIQPNTALQAVCAYHTAYEQIFVYTVQHAGALRVSTTNPGTGPGFDTTITLADSCQTSLAAGTHFLGCNDDDPAYAGDQRRVSSTAVSITSLAAGARVFIAVGGFAPSDAARQHGAYELSIKEVTAVADGAACDVLRLNSVCSDTSTCVGATPTDLMGHCMANGTVAGSECLPRSGTTAAHCSGANLTCDATTGFCVNNAVAVNGACDAFNNCAPGATCISPVRGLARGVCLADGTAVGGPCTTTGTCNTGLTCSTPLGATDPICLVAAGTDCNVSDSACMGNAECVATQGPFSTAGTCAAPGSAAGAACMGSTCTSPLTCSATNMDCVHSSAAGGMCGLYSECATGLGCFLQHDTNDQIAASCVAQGVLGGTCPTTGACTTGTCSNPTDPANGVCQMMAASGGACDFQHACITGETCVRTNTGATAFAGTCHADGSVAGAACARTGTACATGLTCSSFVPDEGICQTAGTLHGACNPRLATTACPTGASCRATALETGTCEMGTAEASPDNNDTPTVAMASTAVTGSALFTGSLPLGDVDCYHVAAPMGMSHFFASVNEPSGLCPGVGVTLTLDLYSLTGTQARLIATDSNSGFSRCPRLDAADPYGNFSFLPTLPAGDYYVCLRNTADAPQNNVPAYALSISDN